MKKRLYPCASVGVVCTVPMAVSFIVLAQQHVGLAEKANTPETRPMVTDAKPMNPETDQVKVAQKKRFFEDSIAHGLTTLAPYAQLPKDEECVPVSRHRQIVKQCTWWIKRIVTKEYRPDDVYIEANLRLVPANGLSRKEDLAFLSYELKGKTYLLVQSGGSRAQMWIFIYDPAHAEVRDSGAAAERARNLLVEYVENSIRRHIRTFKIRSEAGTLVGESGDAMVVGKVIRAKYFGRGRESCLSVQKISFEDTLPGREPAPDHWFEWWRDE